MGATNCPETPRQKMISMMYLVLTALLALNVSAEILNAFILVDDSLKTTATNFAAKNDKIISDFMASDQENHAKVGPWLAKANEVKKKSDEVNTYIDGLKSLLIKTADGPDANSINCVDLKKKDDTNVGGQIMIQVDKKGEELKKKIIEYRTYLLSLVNAKDVNIKNSIEKNLNTDDPKLSKEGGIKKNWEEANFEHLPLAAVITMLSKYQSDVRNCQGEILNYLYGRIDAGSFKFNKLEPIVYTQSNYILSGNEYKAEIFIAASDSTKKPEIKVGNEVLPIVNGKGIYKRTTGGVGVQKWGGVIYQKAPDGTIKEYPFNAEYQVAKGDVVVSPTKMNVFYIGVDNPVEVSVPGVPSDKVFPSMQGGGGSIRKAAKGFIVRCTQATKEAYISVAADINGTKKNMGRMQFRVKALPNPIGKVGGKVGGPMPKSLLLAQSGVFAELENFDFDLKWMVSEFTVTVMIKGYANSERVVGPRFSERQRSLIQQAERGNKIYIEDIKAVGPDGKPRSLPTISLKLQ